MARQIRSIEMFKRYNRKLKRFNRPTLKFREWLRALNSGAVIVNRVEL